MKEFIRKSLYILVLSVVKINLHYYKIKNHNKKKVFIFSDSRGFEITDWKNRKNPFSSYMKTFIKNYNCDVYVATKKHTTILDMLDKLNKNKTNYDFIIAHVGVVDFSPRKYSQLKEIYSYKGGLLKKYFSLDELNSNLKNPYTASYKGEPTVSMYSKDMFIKKIAPILSRFENMIWISCSPILVDWRGSYWDERPKNMNIVLEYDKEVKKVVKNFIDLSVWTPNEIKLKTSDNIHPNKIGFQEIEQNIKKYMV